MNSKTVSGGQRRASAAKQEEAMNYEYDMPIIINVKPEDQLEFAPEELEKEVGAAGAGAGGTREGGRKLGRRISTSD